MKYVYDESTIIDNSVKNIITQAYYFTLLSDFLSLIMGESSKLINYIFSEKRIGGSSGVVQYHVNVIRSIGGLICMYVRGMHVRRLANQAQCLKLNANIDVRDYSDFGCPFPHHSLQTVYSNLFLCPNIADQSIIRNIFRKDNYRRFNQWKIYRILKVHFIQI